MPSTSSAVPGRKTDARDCEWLADLLAHGLIRASVIPPAGIRALRDLARRRNFLRDRVKTTNRIHKLLETAKCQTGLRAQRHRRLSGRAMLRALAEGETDPERWAALGRGSLVGKNGALAAALRGQLTVHHGFLLGQPLAQLDHLGALVEACDGQIATVAAPVQTHIERLQTIVGVGPRSAQVIVSEIGVDMTRFASSAHLASWARICPGTHESAAKRRSAGPAPGITGCARRSSNRRGRPSIAGVAT